MPESIVYKRVSAIVNILVLEKVEQALCAMHVPGMSIGQVQGYGEYHDYYRDDMLCKHAHIEIFCPESEAERVACCIADAAHTGQPGDGIVAILPVERLFRIRTKESFASCAKHRAERKDEA